MNLKPKKDDNCEYPTLSDFQRNRREYLKKVIKFTTVVSTSVLFGCFSKRDQPGEAMPEQRLPGEPMPVQKLAGVPVQPSKLTDTTSETVPKKAGVVMPVDPDTTGSQDQTGKNSLCNTPVKSDSGLKERDEILRKMGVMRKPKLGKIRSVSDPSK